MGRLRTPTGRQRRESPAPRTGPPLTSRRHLDLLRMCGATGRRG
ncbi:hypothetical protein [Streptomyces fuscichromogenes]|nr:hypothetical protein [Streptomyces fuscichromogenes]